MGEVLLSFGWAMAPVGTSEHSLSNVAQFKVVENLRRR